MNLDNIVLYLQLLLCVRAKRIKLIQSKSEPGIAITKNVQQHSAICLKMNTYQFHQLHNQQMYPFQTIISIGYMSIVTLQTIVSFI